MKHNSYFDGKVQSLSLIEQEGPTTIGVIEPGAFTFSTGSEERMTLVSGSMKVRLPGGDWKQFVAGEGFVVASGTSFDVEAKADVAYICRYR